MLSRAVPIWRKQLEEQNGIQGIPHTPQKASETTASTSEPSESKQINPQTPLQQSEKASEEQVPAKPIHSLNTEHLPKAEPSNEKMQETKSVQATQPNPLEQNTNQSQQTAPEKPHLRQLKSAPIHVETPKSKEVFFIRFIESFILFYILVFCFGFEWQNDGV